MKEKIIEHFGGKKPKTTPGAQTLSLMQDRLFLTTNCPSIDGTNPVQIPPFAPVKKSFSFQASMQSAQVIENITNTGGCSKLRKGCL